MACRNQRLAAFLTALLWLSTNPFAAAQTIVTNYQHYRMREGLPSDNVTALYEDGRGYLWVGTNGGLCRFDGTVFETMPVGDNALPLPSVTKLISPDDTLLFIGTMSGVAVYNMIAGRFENHRISDSLLRAGSGAQVILCIQLPRGEMLISAVEYFVRIDRHGNVKAKRKAMDDLNAFYQINNPAVYTRNDSSHILVFTRKGFHEELNLQTLQTTPTRNEFGEAPDLDRIDPTHSYTYRFGTDFRFLHGSYWGFFRYVEPRTGVVKDFGTAGMIPGNAGAPERAVVDPYNPGVVWIATNGGLRRFDDRDKTLELLLFSTGNADFGNVNVFYDLIIDRQGQTWLASLAGLIKVARVTWEFKPLAVEQQHGAKDAFFTEVVSDKRGNLWVQSFGHGVFVETPDGTVRKLPAWTNPSRPGHSNIVFQTFSHSGEMFIATDVGVLRYDERQHKLVSTGWVPDSLLRKGVVVATHRDSRGEWWFGIGGGGGVVRLKPDGTKTVYDHYNHQPGSPHYLPFRYPMSIAEDDHGNLWMGLARYEGKLVKFNRAADTFEVVPVPMKGQSLDRISINGMLLDADQNLWFTTYNHGLIRHNLRSNTWTQYEIHSGLRSNQLRRLTQDAKGNLWVGSNAGVSVLPRGGATFKSFGMRDGMPFDDIGWLGFPFPDYPDRLLITTKGKAQWVDVNALYRALPTPRLDMERIEVESRLYAPRHRNRFTHRQSHFVFHFTSPNLVSGPDNRYAYMLDGLDPDWVDAGSQRFANYANVPPGHYVFRAKARNAGGVWSEPAEFVFAIAPPFWNRWWFYLLVALVSAGVIYAAYRIRINRIVEMERVRSRISRDLHDDIGSTLSSINILTHSARRRLRESDHARMEESLEKIGERTQRMLDNMTDIIWSIKPENDALVNVLARMREYASSLFDARQIDYTIDFPDDSVDLQLPLELKNNLYLVFKEAVNNLAKYSGCTKAFVQLEVKNRSLRLVVEDNGKGFNVSNGSSGNGLRNMKRRAEESNAELQISSQPGHGTRIEFSVNRIP